MSATSQLLRIACNSGPEATPAETDGDLLGRYAACRDEAAFAELVRRNGPVVLRTCRSVLCDTSAAEDAFQAVFLDLARKSKQLARPGSIAGWLHAAAVRTARAARRAELRRRRREHAKSPVPNPSQDEPTWREVREVLDLELASLPEAYRVPLVLCYLQGLTYEQAARRIGCPIGALRGRLERGKERLRIRLARHGLPLGPPILILGVPPELSASLAAATRETVRVGLSGGPVPEAITGLIVSGYKFRVAWLLPVLLLGVVLAAGTLSTESNRIDTPTAPKVEPTTDWSARTDLFGDPLPEGVLARLGTTRCRADIHAFGIQADGTVVTIVGGRDGVIQTWGPGDDRPRTTTPVTLTAPPGPGRTFPCVDISPDGRYVLGSTPFGTVVQERTKEGVKVAASFDIGQRWRERFSADSTQIAVIVEKTEGRKARVCDIPTKKITELEGSAGFCDFLSFSGDGNRLVATSRDRAVLWDARSGKRLAEHETKKTYWSMDLDRTGGVMAAIAWSPSAVLFVDPKTGKPVEGLAGPPLEYASWIRYAPDGKTVLIGGRYGIRWWDPAAGKLIRVFEGVAGYWNSGRFSPDGKMLVSHSEKMLLRWDTTTGKPFFPTAHNGGHQEHVWSMGVTPDGNMVATAGDDGIRIWAAATGKPLHFLSTPGKSCPGMPFSPDSRFLYTPATNSSAPVKWDVTTGKQVFQYTLDPAEPGQTQVDSVWLSSDGGTLMAFSKPEETVNPCLLTVWDAMNGKRLRTTRFEYSRAFKLGPVVISPDGRWLGVGGTVFPLGAGPEADRLAGENWIGEMSPPAAFSADSRLVAVARFAMDRPERPMVPAIYEVATGATLLELPPEAGSGMAFHPNNRSLAVAGKKGLAFWDLAVGKEYSIWKNPNVGGAELRYFPDGSRLVTPMGDTTSLVWQVPARSKRVKPLSATARVEAWDALGSSDGAKAWSALWALADDPGAVNFLRDKVKRAEPLAAKEFSQLLKDLGDDEFSTREAAAKQFEKAGERAIGQLRQALKNESSAERRLSIQRLLTGWEARDKKPPTGEHLRGMRAIAALELAGTVEAQIDLKDLSGGATEAVVTREAKMALDRLKR